MTKHTNKPAGASPEELHRALDVLLARYLVAHPEKVPSTTSVMELLQWSSHRVRFAEALDRTIEQLGPVLSDPAFDD